VTTTNEQNMPPLPGRRAFAIIALVSSAIAFAACGGAPTDGTAAASSIVISVSPTTAEVPVFSTRDFLSSVTGTAETRVTWSIQEGPVGGSLAGGVYTAPGSAGVFHVVAASVADPTLTASATVTVTAAPTPTDSTPPVVAAFAVSGTVSPVTVSAFAGTDDVGVTGYTITQANVPPGAGSGAWQLRAPTSYATLSTGAVTLYPWVRDAAGNVSLSYGAPVTVTLTAPVSSASLGTNLNWMTDWDPEKLPADLMWSARPWALGSGNGDTAANWAAVDSQGWPVVIAGTTFGAIFEGSPWARFPPTPGTSNS
jgi:hypothetical protein